MRVVILAKSSSGDFYDVAFDTEGDILRVICNCKAGSLNQLCKHKMGLMKGDEAMLFDDKQGGLLRDLQSWPQHKSLLLKLCAEESLLADIEQRKAKLSNEERAAKSRMGKLLASGVV